MLAFLKVRLFFISYTLYLSIIEGGGGGGGDTKFHNIYQKYRFLVQSFKETLQYCDEWRKFTSVSQSVSQAVSQSVIV